jgi:G:T-mismatch repair DNA endonuclease (very short patch repair protein)
MAKQIKICEECNQNYSTFNSKQKFCSRTCYAIEDSKRKQEKYKNETHHNTGRKASIEERNMRSKRISETWKDPKIRSKRLAGLEKVRKLKKYPLGWSPESIEKRNNTIKKNGGHNLSGKFSERKCDITYFDKYGKWSYQSLNDKTIKTEFTKPEMLVYKILKQHEIDFIQQYEFKGRYFDFAIPSKKILIEVDGIYWHGKNLNDNELNESQLRTRENDLYKNKLVELSDWKLIRIWEDEINKFEFDKI